MSKYIEKFYGSCGHITSREISKEEFEERSAPILLNGIKFQNEVTEENNDKVVHIRPFNYVICFDSARPWNPIAFLIPSEVG